MITVNHECYVDFEVAKLLKEAGFDWDVYKVYELNQENKKLFGEIANWQGKAVREDVLPMPTLEVAQRWLREVKGIYMSINFLPNLACEVSYVRNGVSYAYVLGACSYEAALEKALFDFLLEELRK